MKNLVQALLALVLVVAGFQSQASTHSKGKSKKVAAAPAKASQRMKKLSTNVNFEDLLIKGQYQYPDEALVTVEDEKDLDDLLQVRPHFKDRLSQASMRH